MIDPHRRTSAPHDEEKGEIVNGISSPSARITPNIRSPASHVDDFVGEHRACVALVALTHSLARAERGVRKSKEKTRHEPLVDPVFRYVRA